VELQVKFSRYGENDLRGASLAWFTSAGANGRTQIQQSVLQTEVPALQSISFLAPLVNSPQRQQLFLEIRGSDGTLLAENSYEYFVFPEHRAANRPAVKFGQSEKQLKALEQTLRAVGYSVDARDDAKLQTVLIAERFDAQVEAQLSSGGSVVLLLDSGDALPAGSPLKLAAREGSDLDGNWVSNFNWIRTNAPPFNVVPFGRLLGLESTSVVPRFLIEGVDPQDYDDVLSGIFYGWLNQNGALAVQMNVGNGKLLATTFRFGAYGKDPYATHLFDSIIGYAAGPQFAPKLQVKFNRRKE
jgi:hypothetical protein